MDFQLRFPLADVNHWASHYGYQDDGPIMAIAQTVQRRGFYTRDEFLKLCAWKAKRNEWRCERNAAEFVEYATRVALDAKNTFERLRIEALLSLEGVDWPVASVLLHFGHADPYPILDFRALWSLGFDKKPQYYSFEFWWEYVGCCRRLREEANVTMRVLDRALWQFSKERQEPS